MPLEANPAIPEGGTGAASWGWIVPVDPNGRKKNTEKKEDIKKK